jgi:hypothetical protein
MIYFAPLYYQPRKKTGSLQVIQELDAQSICEKLLDLEPEVLYSSYLSSSGSRVAEATRGSITKFERLTVMVLPLLPSKESLVLATPANSDLSGIITRAKQILT